MTKPHTTVLIDHPYPSQNDPPSKASEPKNTPSNPNTQLLHLSGNGGKPSDLGTPVVLKSHLQVTQFKAQVRVRGKRRHGEVGDDLEKDTDEEMSVFD